LIAAVCALAGILCQLAGYALYGPPPGADVPHGARVVCGAFLLCLSATLAQLSWGYVVARVFRRATALWEAYLWGTSLTLLALGTIGFLPAVGLASVPYWRAFLLVGCGAALLLARRDHVAPRFCAFDAAAALAFLLALFGASAPQNFWDSLWYHLPAARLWFEAGRIHVPSRLPIAFQTGLWDYEFLLGQILLAGPGGGGLLPAQLFGQWASLGSAVATWLLLRAESEELGLSPWAVFAGVCGTELFFEAEFAKNDFAVVLWSLAALAYARRKRYRLGAFAGGLALAMKLTALFFLAPWGLFLAYELRRDAVRLGQSAALFSLGAAPILLRNAALTGNPYFPALGAWFPSPLQGPSWRGLGAYAEIGAGWAAWLGKLAALPKANAPVLGLAFARKVARRAGPALVMAGVAVAGVLALGPRAEWRFAGAGLVLAAAYGARAVEVFFPRARWLLVPAALVTFPLDWRAPARLFSADTAVFARTGVSGAAMAWVRLHAQPGTAVTLNESRVYYLFPGYPWRAFDDPVLDRALSEARGADELPAIFRTLGIRYLVLSAEFADRAYNRQVCDWAYALSEASPAAVVFRGDLSRVLDLERLPARPRPGEIPLNSRQPVVIPPVPGHNGR